MNADPVIEFRKWWGEVPQPGEDQDLYMTALGAYCLGWRDALRVVDEEKDKADALEMAENWGTEDW